MPCLEKTCLKDFSTISNTNLSVQLVAHWHANFSRLFYEFSRTSLVRIFKCRELVAKVPNMFKFFIRFFFCCLNMSQDCRAIVWRQSFQLPSASIEAYKCSFFPQTIRDWNDLPDSLFSTAEMSDDCVSKFASLVRSRD